MIKTSLSAFLILGLIVTSSCCMNNSDPKPAPAVPPVSKPSTPPRAPMPPPSGQPVELPRISQDKYQGPAVKVTSHALQTYPEQYVANIEITVPTGGWMLELDEGHVIDDVAKVFATLERPAADEIVTQALVTHRTNFNTTKRFTKVEVYVHLATRGIQTLTTDYRLAGASQ